MNRERIKEINLNHIALKYDGGRNIFEDVNFSIPIGGKNIALMGELGSGKSTFLRIAAGLVKPTEGDVLYNQKNIFKMTFEESLPIRMSTSICFENGGLLMNKNLEDNIKLSLMYHNQWRSERSKNLFDELVKDFKLKNYLHLRPAQISTGMMKIAGIVRCFLTNSQIIFLDEPSLGIGPEATLMLKKWIQKFRSEKQDHLVFVATQDYAFAKLLDFEIWTLKSKGIAQAA